MENNNQDYLKRFDFLLDRNAEKIFGKLDFKLKDGEHIQDHGDGSRFLSYIDKYKESLNDYYSSFFGIKLREGGESSERFYFLDFHSDDRKNIPESNRYTVKNEYIIIGLIIYKIIFFEGNIELTSIKKLKKTIRNDYEEYQEGLLKVIVKSNETGRLKGDDDQIDKTIQRTLEQFKKLRWMDVDGDFFQPLPSFHRILSLYGDIIKNIDNIIKTYQ